MKFRIKELEGGHRYIVQYRRKLGFWWNAREYQVSLCKYLHWPNGNEGVQWSHYNYDSAKKQLDKLINYKIEVVKRKRAKKKYTDIIDFDNELDRFIQGL